MNNSDVSHDELLLELSGAVADGEDIDWDSVEAEVPDGSVREKIRRLRLIEQVVRAHGAVSRSGDGEADERSLDIPPGSKVDHYEVVAPIGQGAMGAVFKAIDVVLQREVALKTPLNAGKRDPERRTRFLREARSASKLAHPGIIRVFEAFEHEGRPWLAMELVEGDNLHQLINKKERPGGIELVRRLEDLADALAAAHAAGVLHRDIKPSNVIVGRDGRLRLTDFGLAHQPIEPTSHDSDASTVPRDLTSEGGLVGTPAYMSPERLLGRKADARSDIYSLGALFYELCTGRRAVTGAGCGEMIDAALHREPPPVAELAPGLPAELGQIVQKCLRKDPAERYQDARRLHADLRALRRRLENVETASDLHAAARRRRTRRISLAAVVSVVAVLVAFGTAAFLRPPHPDSPRVRVAVLPLVDATGEADGTLRAAMVADLVAVNLESSRLVRAVGPHRITEILGAAAEPAATDSVGRKLASIAGIDYVASGTLYKDRDGYLAVLATQPLGDDAPVRALKQDGQTASELAERLARDLRRELPGGSVLLAWRDIRPAVDEDLSASEQALLEFSAGRLAQAEGRLGSAITHFEQAVRLDPEFCRGYVGLSDALRQAGYGRRTREAAVRALQLAPSLDDFETRRVALLARLTHARAFSRADDAVAVARELAELEPDEPATRVQYAQALGDAGQLDDAIAEAARAVAAEPRHPRHRLALAGLLADREGRGEDALEEARVARGLFAEIESPEGIAAADQSIGDALRVLGRFDAAVAAYDAAYEGYQAAAREVLAAEVQLGAAQALNQQGRPAAANERLAGTEELARAAGSLRTLARVRTGQGLAAYAGDEYPEAEEALREAIDIARRLDNDRLLWTPLYNLTSMLSYLGRLEEVGHLVDDAAATARRLGNPEWVVATELIGADVAYQRGDLDAAIGAYRRVLDTEGDQPDDDAGWAHLGLAEILDRQGRLDDALGAADRGIEVLEAVSMPTFACYGRVRRAVLLARLGRHDDAAEELARLAERTEGRDVLADLHGRVALARAVAASAAGEHGDALDEAKRALATPHLVPAVTVPALALASEAAAALGRPTEAVEFAARGVSIERAPPAERTYARVALAEALLQANELGRAHEVAGLALEEADRMGLERARRRARAVLEASNGSITRADRTARSQVDD